MSEVPTKRPALSRWPLLEQLKATAFIILVITDRTRLTAAPQLAP
jgi:hypothetical protein